MRDIMTPEQVAAYLQLNTETIYRLIRDKKLAASKIGRAYRVRQADLDAFLLANSTDPHVRDALFQRVRSIAERNGQRFPDLTSDDLLDELERADEERRAPASHGGAEPSLTSTSTSRPPSFRVEPHSLS